MFLMGMIVGAIVWTLVCVAYFVRCCKAVGVDRVDFINMVDTVATAVRNRTSEIQVWHDGNLIDATCLVER